MRPEDASIRAALESTIRSLKRAFPGSKLPVRGLIRARMMLYPAAMMVNMRRLHGHLTEEVEDAAQEGAFSFSFLKTVVSRCLKSIHRRLSSLTPQSTAISASEASFRGANQMQMYTPFDSRLGRCHRRLRQLAQHGLHIVEPIALVAVGQNIDIFSV